MNARPDPTTIEPLLHTAKGEPPRSKSGRGFLDNQGEMFQPDNPNHRGHATWIGVLQLDNGKWLAHRSGFAIDDPQFDTREKALRASIAYAIRKFRGYGRNKFGEIWELGYVGRLCDWALSLKPQVSVSSDVLDNIDSKIIERSGDNAEPSQAPVKNNDPIIDPVIAELVAQNGARKLYPVGHVIHHTMDYSDPDKPMRVGVCDCSATFRFKPSQHREMDAAIEAHWQKFDAEPLKTDGRGRPIVPGFACAEGEDCHCQVVDADHDFAATVDVRTRCGNWRATDAKSGDAERRGPWFLWPDAPNNGAETDELAVLQAIRDSHAVALSGVTFDRLIGDRLVVGKASPHLTKRGRARLDQLIAEKTESGAALSAASPGPALSDSLAPQPPGGAGFHIDDDDIVIDWPSYDGFLESKIVSAPLRGIEVARADLHDWLKPHCKDLTLWALRLGCAAIFANFGLHKTAMQLEWCRQLHKHTGSPTLNVLPLGVRHGFVKEALQLDIEVRFVRSTAEFDALYVEGVRHFLTNYESIRDGKLDPNLFAAVSLDEASVLRSYGSKTFQEFLPLFAKVPFKLVATATPSPNRYKELIHYSGFLGVMDTGQALTRFFQRDSEKAGNLTLYPHKVDEFWMWVCSWAAFLQKPSDLGYSDEGYEQPPLKVRWHEVLADHSKAEPERDGQGVLFRNAAAGLSQAAASKRDSLPARIEKMREIIARDPDAHRLLWHDLEAEREAIEQAVPGVVTITGAMDLDEREARLVEFEEGRIKYFGTKPILSGSGSNFQYHCHEAIFLGVGYKFNDFIQAIHRLQRFGQRHEVGIDIIYSEDERDVRAALEAKWARDTEMRARVSEIIRKYGLNTLPMRDALARSIGVKRVEVKGEKFTAINNDAVAECKTWPENSVDQIVTSVPFSNHYEYSASYNDFGHTDDNAHFWGQMDFLTAELLRMLKPGRLACIHVKDRILFGAVTGAGAPTISPFHAEAIMHYRAHGFDYMGMIHVNTDVVRENNQTYRLGWSECCKDGTKMGVGSPEYVLLMRKPQSNRGKGYADVPVEKSKDEYSRARWQIDAHAFWRSSGNRFLTPEEFAGLGPAELAKAFTDLSLERIYDYEAHVKIGEELERKGALPATFMCIAPGATDANTWHDVNRMRTLNGMQHAAGRELHLCPLQFDIVDRLIERFSNPGDLIFDPFGGLMTVPYRAILKGRRGAATELAAPYFLDGVKYLQMAEEQMTTPQLFDLAKFDEANAPPPLELEEAET